MTTTQDFFDIAKQVLQNEASGTERAVATLVTEAAKAWPDLQFEVYRRTTFDGPFIRVHFGVEPKRKRREDPARADAIEIIQNAIQETADNSDAWSFSTAATLIADRLGYV